MTDRNSTGSGTVLLLGGPSGAGKSTAAKDLSRTLGIGWVQVDDLRLAFQASGAQLPTVAATDALRFFEQGPEVWNLPPEHLCEQLLALGFALSDAIAIVAANHIVQGDSAIIEGDTILPSLLYHPLLQPYAASETLEMVLVLPGSEAEIRQAMTARGRDPDEKIVAASRMNWMFAAVLRNQAAAHGINSLNSQPQATLAQRLENHWNELSDHAASSSLV